MALAFVIAALFLIAAVAAGRVVALTSACQLHEAREGTGYEQSVGLTVDEFAAIAHRRFVVRSLRSDDVPSGRIARVSTCGAPRGADLVVYIARP